MMQSVPASFIRSSGTSSRVGIVGCGDLAQRTLLPCLLSPEGRERFTLDSVWSPAIEDCRVMVKNLPNARIADSLEDLLKEEKIDTVWILSPAREHFHQTRKALESGKHVYVQKPMAGSLAEVDTLIALAEKAGKWVSAAPALMGYPGIQLLRERLNGNVVGPLYAVAAPFMGWGGREIDWP